VAETPAAVSRCAHCGADLPSEGAPCPACAVPSAAAAVEAVLLPHEACAAEPEAAARGQLWARIAVAVVYLAVGVLCAYGCYSFFHDAVALSDWVFGAMALGLVVIALLGVKESLFPSRWTPE
jgi:hypothetical protein